MNTSTNVFRLMKAKQETVLVECACSVYLHRNRARIIKTTDIFIQTTVVLINMCMAFNSLQTE